MTHDARKTPFFQISVADSKGSKFVPIPYQVHRLIEKIEIKEMFGTGWCVPGQFTIYLLEGSREPYPMNKQVNTSVSYPLDSKGSGTLTNNVGMLADLRYTDNGGGESITSLAKTATGMILDNLQDAADLGNEVAGALLEDNPLEAASKDSPKLITTDKKTPPVKPVKYIFQQRNQIKIVWGYVEDLQNRRSVIGYINGIDLEYPENDHPKVKIVAADPSMHFDQVSGIFGASFFNSSTNGVTVFGDPIVSFENMTIKEVIEKFSDDAGMAEPIVSDEFDDIELDKYAFNVVPAGMSPNQFFGELSKKYDAYYKVQVDPSTGEDTIVFLSKREYNAKLISNDKTLLTYKNPGSIIKSVQLKAEYTNLNGHAKGFVTEKGELTAVAGKTPVQVGIVEAGSQYTDSDPTGNNPVTSAKGTSSAFNSPFSVGTHEYTPEGNSVKTVTRQTDAKNNCHLEDTVTINLTTIGYPKLRPGPWYIGGLGQRYSAVYYFKEVTHTIEAAGGYVCTLMGGNNSDLSGTGKSADGVAQTQKIQEQADVGMFNVKNPGGSATDKFNSNQETGD